MPSQKMFQIVTSKIYILKIYRWENILSRKCYFPFSSVDNIHLRLKHPYEKTNKMIVNRWNCSPQQTFACSKTTQTNLQNDIKKMKSFVRTLTRFSQGMNRLKDIFQKHGSQKKRELVTWRLMKMKTFSDK